MLLIDQILLQKIYFILNFILQTRKSFIILLKGQKTN